MKKMVKVVSLACASAMLVSTTAFADGDAFKVGGIGPVTGGAAVYGQAVKNATELAVNEINAAWRQFSSSSSLRMTSMMQRSLSTHTIP